MKKRLLFLISCFLSLVMLKAQDSTYYYAFWEPTQNYQRAGVKQEGAVLYNYKNNVIKDSFLLYTKLYDSLGRTTRLDEYRGNKRRTRWLYYYSGTVLDSVVQEEVWLKGPIVHRYSYNNNGQLSLEQASYGNIRTAQLRYVYNHANQLLQIYRQLGNGLEELTTEYIYRKDRLIQQINHFQKMHSANRFSYLYSYDIPTNTTTKLFEKEPGSKRLIDCIRIYNAAGQLVEKINPPLPKNSWLPPDIHPRTEENVERYFYLPNGMLSEKQVSVNDKLVRVEKHLYVY